MHKSAKKRGAFTKKLKRGPGIISTSKYGLNTSGNDEILITLYPVFITIKLYMIAIRDRGRNQNGAKLIVFNTLLKLSTNPNSKKSMQYIYQAYMSNGCAVIGIKTNLIILPKSTVFRNEILDINSEYNKIYFEVHK